MQRLLEGEVYTWSGVGYVVKGIQHPPGFIVAYPRYNLLSRAKLAPHERKQYEKSYYWDCIKTTVSVIPTNTTLLGNEYIQDERPLYLKSLLESLLETEIYLTGSALVTSSYNDVDFVIYGADGSIVERLERLFEKEIIARSERVLIEDYMSKHAGYIRLVDYLHLKKNTVLHGVLGGIHVNFKLLEPRRGYGDCIDPVYHYEPYTGVIEVIEAMNPHVLPARYRIQVSSREVIMESLRELYSEVPPGRYYVVNARIEYRRSGVYLVPDHGALKILE